METRLGVKARKRNRRRNEAFIRQGEWFFVPVAEVFYSNQKPYVRAGRTSRPAEPEEVVERVWAHPSSEHKRNLERLKFASLEQNARQRAEERQKNADQMHELQQRFINRQ